MEAKHERDMAAEADAAAFREALGETVNISVKKERGSAAFLPRIEATSAPAALNGMPATRKQRVEKQEEV